jgi:hypothetical protein
LVVGGCDQGCSDVGVNTGLDRREDGRFDQTQPAFALPLRTWGARRRYIVQEAASSAVCSATNELYQDLCGHRLIVEQNLLLECRGPYLRGLGGANVSTSLEPPAQRGAHQGRNSRLEAPAGSKTAKGRVGLQGDNRRRTGVYWRPRRLSSRARL